VLQRLNLIHTIIVIILGLMCAQKAAAQQHGHTHPEPADLFRTIDSAQEAGLLTPDESILQKFYAGFEPGRLNDAFKPASDASPIKCMVPAMRQFNQLRDQLLPSTVMEIEELIQPRTNNTEFSYRSPSGVFEIHYDTTGSDAVPSKQTIPEAIEQNIPNYIYHAAFAADSSYRHQVETLGFTDFRRSTPYLIEFQNFGFYGTTTSSGSSSFITVHSNFNSFPPNAHPEGDQIGALYVTIAHEVKHAVQYEANRWRGSAGSFDWIEMDATMAEEMVFDNVNDYYNYIRKSFESPEPNRSSIFGNPRDPTPGAYWHTTWMFYFSERFGDSFWVDVWNDIRNDPLIPFSEAVEQQLALRNEDFASNHLENHLWHLASGPLFSESGFGFREREFYPEAFIGSRLASIPDSLSGTGLRPMAADYLEAVPNRTALGQPQITVESDAPGVGIGVIGTFRDGRSETFHTVNTQSLNQQIQTQWSWRDLTDLKIAVVNTNQSGSADYKLKLTSVIPENDILAQNYPNPFNPTTRIEFSLNNRKNVRIDVFDSIGRQVTTLLNDTLNEGFHFVDFNGSGLSSGVYFYRIRTDQTVTTNKMLLLK